MFALQLLRDGVVALVQRIGDRPVHIGRATANDLILNDPTISEHHAVVWARPAGIFVRDLGSTNGTFVNGDQIDDARSLEPGDHLRIGAAELVAAKLGERRAPPLHRVLEDSQTGVCLPLLGSRVKVGSGPDCDLVLVDAPDRLFDLLTHPDGELWLGTEKGERGVELEESFEVEGRSFIVRPATGRESSTVVPSTTRAIRYRLDASLTGPTGPVAQVTELASGTSHRVEAENRAILLFLLGRATFEDHANGTKGPEAGWRADEQLRRDIWGRHSRDNQLNVLLHRLRGELRGVGIDPWFIEKKRRYTRARVVDVHLG